MKNSKKILTCTLGLMLGVGLLVGCGETAVYTVTFKEGSKTLNTAEVKAGETCPEYVPEGKTGYTFMGWYTTRQHEAENKFDFATPIESDMTLYAWYKKDFVPSTDVFFVVGSFKGFGTGDGYGEGSYWDGTTENIAANRIMTHTTDTENEKNIYTFEIPDIGFGEKFRIIKSTDGVKSDGWTDTYGYDLVSKVLGPDGAEMDKATAIKEEDSKNIGVQFAGKLKVTLTLESEFSANGEIVLQLLEEKSIAYPEAVSVIGAYAGTNWDADTDLTSTDEGATWSTTITFAVGDIWKLRMNHAWDVSWGFGAIKDLPAGSMSEGLDDDGNGNGNIVVDVAGEYTITLDYLAGTITITSGATGPVMVTTPEAGVAYKWGINQETLGKTLFFTGAMKESADRFALTTENAADAVDVILVAVDGGYNLTYKVGDATKYLNVVKVGTFDNLQSQDSAASVWTWDSTYNTLVTELDGKTFYCGAYNDYDTIGASNYDSYAAKDGQFHAHLYVA